MVIKGGKIRKGQTFYCHEIKSLQNTPKHLKVLLHQKKSSQKEKNRSRRAIRRELGNAVQSNDQTTNTSVSGILQTSTTSRKAIVSGKTTVGTVRKVNRFRKNLKEYKRKNPKGKIIHIEWRKRQIRVLGKIRNKEIKKAAKKGTKNIGQNTKNVIVGGLRKEGTTDSSAGSMHMTIRTSEMIGDTIHYGKKAYKAGRKFHNYRKERKAKKKAVKTMKSTFAHQAKNSMQRKGISFLLSAIKKTLMRQPVFIICLLIGMILFGLLSSISICTSMTMLGTNFILMDEQTASQYQNEMKSLEDEFQKKIDTYKNNSEYDDVRIDYMGEGGKVNPNWQELLSVMAVEFEQNLTFSYAEKKRMEKLFYEMNEIQTRTERYYCSGCCTCGESELHCHGHLRLIVEIYSYGMDDINLNLEDWQLEWARNLVTMDFSMYFPDVCQPMERLSQEEITELLRNAPTSSATREEIRMTALSLVGRVKYFWGGKSSAGWNKSWGKSVKVTSPGDSTTGTYQPYGLDCSGFTDWVYKTAGAGNLLSGGSSHQWDVSYPISEKDLQVGDLVFKQPPGTGKNHVGIFIGRDENGKKLYCHCAWSQGVTIDSYKGFKYFRRPYIKFDESLGKGVLN